MRRHFSAAVKFYCRGAWMAVGDHPTRLARPPLADWECARATSARGRKPPPSVSWSQAGRQPMTHWSWPLLRDDRRRSRNTHTHSPAGYITCSLGVCKLYTMDDESRDSLTQSLPRMGACGLRARDGDCGFGKRNRIHTWAKQQGGRDGKSLGFF